MSEHVEQVTGSGPGQQLREARERAGLGREEVAEQLNLNVAHIAALEEERYGALPGATYVQGYLRAYARLLGLDAAQLLAAFNASRPAPEPAAQPAVRRRPSLDHGTGHRYWGLVAVLFLVVGVWWWQQHDDEPSLSTLPEMAELEPVPQVSDLPPAVEEAAPAAIEGEPGDELAISAGDIGVQPNEASLAADAALAAEPEPALEPQVQTPMLAADRLQLRFSDDCWVEVTDGRGKVVVAELKRADETLEIEGQGPFKVLLGFAPAVEMAFNGRPVAVEASGRNQTATLVVGNS